MGFKSESRSSMDLSHRNQQNIFLDMTFHGFKQPHKPSFNVRVCAYPVTMHAQETRCMGLDSLEDALSYLKQPAKLPSHESLIIVLENCRKEKNLALARCAHACIRDLGLEVHRTLGNYLVPMFVECGSVSDAEKVFERLAYRNEYSWTSLIHGYNACGVFENALGVYPKMLLDSVSPSRYTFLALLQACAALGSSRRSLEVHSEIMKMGLEGDQFIGNALVDVYGKCRTLSEAQSVFDRLAIRDVVSWSTLISAYTDCKLDEKALELSEEMQEEGLSPNAVTFVSSVKACIRIGAIDKGQELHVAAAKEGLDMNTFVGNTLIDMYAKVGSLVEARDVFDEMQAKDIVSWNALISGYVERGWEEEALDCLQCMQLEGLAPDAITYVCALKACGSLGALDLGKKLHMDIVKTELEKNVYVGSALVDMYAKCQSLIEAREVFDKLEMCGLILWNTLLAGYARCGTLAEAVEFFQKMPDCDVVSWNIIVAAHVDRGLLEGALYCLEQMQLEGVNPSVVSWNSVILGFVEHAECVTPFRLYSQMQEQGVLPDDVTFMSIMKACGDRAYLDVGKRFHSHCRRLRRIEATVVVDMYAKCGSMRDAQKVFDAMPGKDMLGWSTLIAGYARQGKSDIVFFLLERMEAEGIRLDGVAFLHVLVVCSHAGLVQTGEKYFEDLSKVCKSVPTLTHYNCMVNLLGRAGQLDVVRALLQNMPFPAESSTWNTVLSVCRKWGSMNLGNEAFANAAKLDESFAEPYILMANIYAHHLGDG
eukprot:c23727_g1_i1 orf=910-3204(+)